MSDYIPITFIDETLIPQGMYCYTVLEMHNDKGYFLTKLCPYWRRDPLRGEQENGYCLAFNINDWDEGFGILWDQVRVCAAADDFEECDYEDDE